MKFQDYFPQGRLGSASEASEQTYALPLDDQVWLLEKASLSQRERALIELLLQPEKSPSYQHPWLDFLEGRGRQPDFRGKAVQFVHLHIRQTNLREFSSLFDMLKGLIPNYHSHFQVAEKDFVLLLDQSLFFDVTTSLQDTLEAMEFDFASQLSFLVGTVLSVKSSAAWPGIFQLECALFSAWNRRYSRSASLSFSRLYLWHAQKEVSFANYLLELIQSQEGLSEIILALWQESAVLTKAAQQLYIHRNTLQYRIEKFYEATGLSLKKMDDLALCYLIVLEQTM